MLQRYGASICPFLWVTISCLYIFLQISADNEATYQVKWRLIAKSETEMEILWLWSGEKKSNFFWFLSLDIKCGPNCNFFWFDWPMVSHSFSLNSNRLRCSFYYLEQYKVSYVIFIDLRSVNLSGKVLSMGNHISQRPWNLGPSFCNRIDYWISWVIKKWFNKLSNDQLLFYLFYVIVRYLLFMTLKFLFNFQDKKITTNIQISFTFQISKTKLHIICKQ